MHDHLDVKAKANARGEVWAAWTSAQDPIARVPATLFVRRLGFSPQEQRILPLASQIEVTTDKSIAAFDFVTLEDGGAWVAWSTEDVVYVSRIDGASNRAAPAQQVAQRTHYEEVVARQALTPYSTPEYTVETRNFFDGLKAVSDNQGRVILFGLVSVFVQIKKPSPDTIDLFRVGSLASIRLNNDRWEEPELIPLKASDDNTVNVDVDFNVATKGDHVVVARRLLREPGFSAPPSVLTTHSYVSVWANRTRFTQPDWSPAFQVSPFHAVQSTHAKTQLTLETSEHPPQTTSSYVGDAIHKIGLAVNAKGDAMLAWDTKFRNRKTACVRDEVEIRSASNNPFVIVSAFWRDGKAPEFLGVVSDTHRTEPLSPEGPDVILSEQEQALLITTTYTAQRGSKPDGLFTWSTGNASWSAVGPPPIYLNPGIKTHVIAVEQGAIFAWTNEDHSAPGTPSFEYSWQHDDRFRQNTSQGAFHAYSFDGIAGDVTTFTTAADMRVRLTPPVFGDTNPLLFGKRHIDERMFELLYLEAEPPPLLSAH